MGELCVLQKEKFPDLNAFRVNIHSFVDQMCHTHLKLKFKELQDRRAIVFDSALVRAAQLADIHLLNEAKERGNDMKFLVQMYFGLEEGFNKLLRSRVLSAKSSSAE